MTPTAKHAVLAAYDALVLIATSAGGCADHPRSHGGSAGCGYCGVSLASGGHRATCPIGLAMKALGPLLPR